MRVYVRRTAVQRAERQAVNIRVKPTDLIAVCDKCLCASCWAGVYMCEVSRGAGVIKVAVAELRKLKRESPLYWRDQLKANRMAAITQERL